ncbi:MAG: citrate/2-methylcitrate synthase [Candidatus Geothermarchaeales archaeon]
MVDSGLRVEIRKGLEGVYLDTSELSFINGERGELVYLGYHIDELAGKASFEEVAYLLWYGRLPKAEELADFSKKIRAEYRLSETILETIELYPRDAQPMDVLRTTVSCLAMTDPDVADNSRDAEIRKGIRLVAKFPVILAAFQRLRSGKDVVKPRGDLSLAANFLYMLTGGVPDESAVEAMDMALVLHADHSMNASTFASRVVASTLSDVHAAVTAGIGCLKGPLHGGANQRVVEMLDKIGKPENAQKYIVDMLARREKVPGFGHRVYKTLDPRSVHLKKATVELADKTGRTNWYEMLTGIQDVMMEKVGPRIAPNVDLYSGSVYAMLGIPTDMFTPIFAMSRVSGWVAHVMEQHSDNRIIRPRVQYVGRKGLKFVPIDQR